MTSKNNLIDKMKLNSILPISSNDNLRLFNEDEAKQVTEVGQKLLCQLVKEIKENGKCTSSID